MKKVIIKSPQKRLVVLISGNGSNLQAIINACENQSLNANVIAVISNNPDAYGLKRAKKHGIPQQLLEPFNPRAAYDAKLAEIVKSYQPDYIVLAGWLRILSMNFLKEFPNQVINLHPALPEQFAGLNAIERAFKAYQKGDITKTGVMVHFVPDEGVDTGPVIKSESLEIKPDDTLETLEEKMHKLEHSLLIESLISLCH